MEFTELVSPSLTDLFVEQMTDMILSGKIKPGEKLPTEREMAKQMKVSLAVINGGITRLAANGFLEIRPRKGVFVADYIRVGNLNTLQAVLKYSGDMFDQNVYDSLYQFRVSIESHANRMAVKNHTKDNIRRMEEYLENYHTTNILSEKAENAYLIHHEAALASGSIYYPMLMQSVKPFYIYFYEIALPDGKNIEHIVYDMLAMIIEGIKNSDEALEQKAVDKCMKHWSASMSKRIRKK